MPGSDGRPHPNRARAGLWAAAVAGSLVVVVGVVWLTASRNAGRRVEGTTRASEGPAVGAEAPPVRLDATTGGTIDVGALRGRRNVLLYFYEHAG